MEEKYLCSMCNNLFNKENYWTKKRCGECKKIYFRDIQRKKRELEYSKRGPEWKRKEVKRKPEHLLKKYIKKKEEDKKKRGYKKLKEGKYKVILDIEIIKELIERDNSLIHELKNKRVLEKLNYI